MILGQGAELQANDFPLHNAGPAPRASKTEWSVEELAEHLPEQLNLRDTLGELERALIERALRLANGIQAEAARQLELSRSDIGYKLAKYSLGTPARGALPKSSDLAERAEKT